MNVWFLVDMADVDLGVTTASVQCRNDVFRQAVPNVAYQGVLAWTDQNSE